MIRVAIVEDESGAQEALCGLCERYSKESGESVAQEAFHFILGEGNWLC